MKRSIFRDFVESNAATSNKGLCVLVQSVVALFGSGKIAGLTVHTAYAVPV